jgi:hypothetical protein
MGTKTGRPATAAQFCMALLNAIPGWEASGGNGFEPVQSIFFQKLFQTMIFMPVSLKTAGKIKT